MPRNALRPVPSLAEGSRVALLAPAGQLSGRRDVERSVANARSLGWEPVVGKHALSRDAYFAGSDTDRVADINTALRDRSIDGIWCIRGGYGAVRILNEIDYSVLTRRPRPIIGYSDVTALLAAIAGKCGIVSFHGPTARSELTPFTRASLIKAVRDGEDPCGRAPRARTIRKGRASGTLAGGNLSLLASLCGTPYAPVLANTILVLEDVGEATYRVDRMLRQLHLSGMLTGVKGIAFGHCTSCSERAENGKRSLDDVLAELADSIRVPCVSGFPIGHVADKWTIPIGARAELDADLKTLNVTRPGVK